MPFWPSFIREVQGARFRSSKFKGSGFKSDTDKHGIHEKGSRFRGSGFKVIRLQPLDTVHHLDQDPEYRHTLLDEKAF